MPLTRIRWGVVSFADSLDCVGIISNDTKGVKRVFGKSEHLRSLEYRIENLQIYCLCTMKRIPLLHPLKLAKRLL